MTKPIEGWVAVSADGEVSVYTDIEDPRSDHIAIYLRKQPGLDYRPVRITFTDEPNEEAAEAADIVRKIDRWRIWEGLIAEIGPYSFSETDDGEKEFITPSEHRLRKIIFGEEK